MIKITNKGDYQYKELTLIFKKLLAISSCLSCILNQIFESYNLFILHLFFHLTFMFILQ